MKQILYDMGNFFFWPYNYVISGRYRHRTCTLVSPWFLLWGGGSRVIHTDFGMGGDLYPPIGGGHMGGDKGPMGGDSRVNRDKIGSPLK